MPDVPINPRLHSLQGELRSKHLVIHAARQVRRGWVASVVVARPVWLLQALLLSQTNSLETVVPGCCE
jgi:hypothetical protein